ncbi:MAG: FAD-binding oxidoreductase [Thermoguttaceae bacterium]
MTAERYFPGSTVIEASDAAEAARVIADACAEGRAVYPLGGGTSLALGAAAERPGTVLALGKLNRLIDYPSRDLTITVEAGMTVGQLAWHLSAENQRLPIDVHGADSATVGGLVAANLSGPRRYRFGTVRDYQLGVTVVDGTGESFSAGGRVVKNAAGYDLTRLMIGSLGTLGVITQATFMVRPVPETSALVSVPLSDLEKGESLLDALAGSSLEPTAIELVAGGRLPAALSTDAPAGLWIGLEGGGPEVRWMLDALTELCARQGLAAAVCDDAQSVESAWRALTEHGSIVPTEEPESTLSVEATVLPSRCIALVLQLARLHPAISLHAHAGSGVVVARLACEAEGAGQAAAEFRREASRLGGRAVVTAWPAGSRLDRLAVWGPRGGEMRVMERIKQQFDPQGILNPGRFIFESAAASAPS